MVVHAVWNGVATMDPYVVQQNISRFQEMLEQERDPAERAKLCRLIEREQLQLEEAIQRNPARS